jgi:hypothetical protein
MPAAEALRLYYAVKAARGTECGDNLGFISREECLKHIGWLNQVLEELETRVRYEAFLRGSRVPPVRIVTRCGVEYEV